MSRSYVKILLTLFFTQGIVAQLSPVTWNGCQNCQNVNSHASVSNSNFPVANNIGLINGQQNGLSQLSGFGQLSGCSHQNGNTLNELQSIPKMSFVNGQITDLINFASKINKQQLIENKDNDPVHSLASNNPCTQVNSLDQLTNDKRNNIPITFYPNTVVQNHIDNFQSSNICAQENGLNQNIDNEVKKVPITFYPNTVVQNNGGNVMSSNLCSQVNYLNQGGNTNQLNNIPITFYPNFTPVIQNNLVPNNVAPSDCDQNKLVPNFVANTGVPINFYPNYAPNNMIPTNVQNNIANNVVENNDVPFTSKNSLFNNGIDTNRYQQNIPIPCSKSIVDLPKINSLILTGEACNNGQPFSVLPANSFNTQAVSTHNDIIDNSFKITRSLPTETSYPANNIENNIIPVQNNAYNEAVIRNKVIGKLIPVNYNLGNKVQDPSSTNLQLTVIGNNGYSNQQLISNQQDSVNQLQQPAYQNYLIPTATNWPATNTGGQSTGNLRQETTNNFNFPEILNMPDVGNYNLPDLANINMLNLGELGTLPIFSGLPVIGITETVTVVNPKQLSRNQIYGYL